MDGEDAPDPIDSGLLPCGQEMAVVIENKVRRRLATDVSSLTDT
jgi:hypothetical protein